MKILLPLSALRAHNACGLDERIAAFTAFHGHAPNENTPFSAWVEVTPKVGDLTWATRCLFEAGKRIAVKIAVQAARRALPVWKSVNPEDLRPRLAIEAVENWLLGKVTTEECRIAATDAYAAYIAYITDTAAAYAAYTAYAAATTTATVTAICTATAAAATAAAYAAIDDARDAAYAAERARQRADFIAAIREIEVG